MEIEKNLKICKLYELYGDFLSEKQKDMIYKHYFLDMSFSEIADGATRQAVNDSLKRAVLNLENMENKLHLAQISNVVFDKNQTDTKKIELLKKIL